MRKLSPADARQLSPGDKVALLVGDYDPPHMDYFRAVEALFLAGHSVWLCPLFGGEAAAKRARPLATVMAIDFLVATRRQPSCCLVGLDKRMRSGKEVAEWCRVHYPFLKFSLASFGEPADVVVKFGAAAATKSRGAIVLDKFAPVGDVRAGIAAGRDESRCFTPGVWGHIQAKRLYR